MSPRQTMSLGDTLMQLLFRFIVNTVYGAYLIIIIVIIIIIIIIIIIVVIIIIFFFFFFITITLVIYVQSIYNYVP